MQNWNIFNNMFSALNSANKTIQQNTPGSAVMPEPKPRMQLQVRPNHISPNGLECLKAWEGTGPIRGGRFAMYKDVAGYPTIGYGHLLTKSEITSGKMNIAGNIIKWADGLDMSQATALLDQDCDPFEGSVATKVKVALTQNQFDALVIFAFNVGQSAFENSTLLKVLNQGQYDQVPVQLMRWTKAGGKKVQGLVNRRQNEINLWNAGV